MNPSSNKIWFIPGLLLAFVVAACVTLVLPTDGQPAYTPDSIFYLLASRAISEGHGISIPGYELFDPHFVPYTTWPPLYPVLLATGMPPLLLQAILLGCIAAVSYLLLTRVAKVGAVMAVVLALLITLAWPLLMDASYVWSELFALFWVSLSLYALGALWINRSTPSRVVLFWFLAVLAVCCAIYTRYASLVFIPAIVLVLLRAPIKMSRRWVLIISTPIMSGFLIFPLLLRNKFDSGSLSGTLRPASTLDISTVTRDVSSYISWVFGIEAWQQIIFVLSVMALPAVVLACRLESKGSTQVFSQDSTGGGDKWLAWMAASYALAYLFGISALRLWRDFDLTVRMLSPAIPWVLLGLAAWAVIVWRGTNITWQRIVLVSPFAALFFLAATTSFQLGLQAHIDWRNTGSPQWRMNGTSVYSNLYPVRMPKIVGVVLSSRPGLMSFRTGWDFRRIPSGQWSHAMLMRIADAATGLLIDSRQAARLARALHDLVPNPRVLRLGSEPLLIWGPPRKP
ncbi:hypothetical protein [Acidihalobacter aeolianus]|uniref:hypothetical protein n=1 Tax=Acidihalobacter aeolianus TaxID=2792603 RepID=UPI0012EAE071|nr:hypothetical protein [Acidihalobacter aeolianus]